VQLNRAQSDAVGHRSGPLLIIAGAGAGKTRVLTERTVSLARQGVFLPSILNVTFTRRAAMELTERVLAGTGQKGVQAYTFHSWCARACREHAEKIGRKPDFTVYDQDASVDAIEEVAEGLGCAMARKVAHATAEVISRLKDDGFDAADFEEGAPRQAEAYAAFYLYGGELPDEAKAVFPQVFEGYALGLERWNALDFGGLILSARNLLREHESVRARYHRVHRYLQVDEFQDTNFVQYELVRLLTGPEKNVAAVGDDAQAIYGWRGARYDNVFRFREDFPEARLVKLEENYRSGGHVLQVANTLIKANTRQIPKEMRAARGLPGVVTMTEYATARDEAEAIAQRIVEQQGDWKEYVPNYREHAVLYRINAMSYEVERALSRRRIPYTIIGGVAFWAREEIRDAMAYLSCAMNTDDRMAFQRIAGKPKRGLGKVTFEALRRDGRGLGEQLRDPGKLPKAATLRGLGGLFERYRLDIASGRGELGNILMTLLIEAGYTEWLKGKENAGARFENLNEISRIATSAGTFQTLMEESLAFSAQDGITDSDVVQLMTIHAAKGLEFGNVYAIGLEEGVLPARFSADVDEERRLAYVAFTRAKDELHVSCCEEPRFPWAKSGGPSRFIYDAKLEEFPPLPEPAN